MKKYIGLILIGLFLLAIMVSLWRVMQYSFLIKLSLELLILVILFPFIYLVILNIQGKQGDELKIYGVGFKDFMTTWIAFWGLLGVSIGVIQVQHQIKSQKEQFDTQIQIQQKQLRDSRFSSGVELLGSEKESARIGGVYNLYFLAKEDSAEYLNPVCEILCAHVRTITSDTVYREKYKEEPSNETETILDLLFRKDLIFDECRKDLKGTFLFGADFDKATLSKIDFTKATLSKVEFMKATLNDVEFQDAILSGVRFEGTALNGVRFEGATLSGVRFEGATLSGVYFWGAKLSGVNFWDATLSGVNFLYAELSGVNFWGAKLSGVNFYNTVLEGYSYEEITSKDFSLEKTKSKDK